jgi:hypothetical protein
MWIQDRLATCCPHRNSAKCVLKISFLDGRARIVEKLYGAKIRNELWLVPEFALYFSLNSFGQTRDGIQKHCFVENF